MRRTIMTAVATLSLAAPSVALAHNGARHHHRHHHHARLLAFHAQTSAGSPSGTTSSGASDTAGTIASFSGGVLTIKLNDGSTVSGKVTERTEIECPAPTANTADFSGGDRGDDDGLDDRSDDQGGSGCPGDQNGDGPGDDDNDQGEHCTTAALVVGASVEEAFLSVSKEGATWVKVEL
ncbi:MAG TPA: hypothetical protein VN672_05930 [Solirubrobacteraceae bacterium]|nr:hypothetical protein [Solirubrobacteraceae bacterium]